jgi:UDP:flavonoid glycosyltransferase YjiC (YdhE family)
MRKATPVRILFSHAGGSGHLMPLMPFAQAAATRGHNVGFVAQDRTANEVTASGLPIVTEVPPPGDQEVAAAFQRANALPTLFEQVDQGLCDVFASIFAQHQIPAVLQACDAWQPDLIVRDEADFGGAIAAELAGIPSATVLVVAAGSFVRGDLVAKPLNELRIAHGLLPDPAMQMLEGDLTLCPFPPSFRDPDFPLPANTMVVRTTDETPTSQAALPAWVDDLTDAPVIYFSLGTVFNTIRQDLFKPVIEGVRELPVSLVVTVGHDVDIEALGAQPPNVYVEQFIPQGALLPHCDLIINHAGSGSLNGAFTHGLPVIVIPLGADQPYNAQRCVATGIGEALDASAITAASVGATVRKVLNTRSYRQQAQRLRIELQSLPGVGRAVEQFEKFA